MKIVIESDQASFIATTLEDAVTLNDIYKSVGSRPMFLGPISDLPVFKFLKVTYDKKFTFSERFPGLVDGGVESILRKHAVWTPALQEEMIAHLHACLAKSVEALEQAMKKG